jgi:acetylornithine deacetylase/succinyl-diaminopimelate desuccinylase-like protein
MKRLIFYFAVASISALMNTSTGQTGAPTGANTSNAISGTVQQQVAALVASRDVHSAFDWFGTHIRQLTDMQLEVTAIPAPPFGEAQRAAWAKSHFEQAGLEQVHIDSEGNVLGIRRGTDLNAADLNPKDPNAKYVMLSAHLDTIFPCGTKLNVHRQEDKLHGPGISDNGAGVTALLGIAAAMNDAGLRTKAPILFVANVGEEGEGDLRGMRHIFSDPQWKDAIGYTVVLDGGGSDSIVTQGLGSRRFLVTINGPGGHSWSDFGTPNPVVVLARVIDRFSRTSVPAVPKTTFNIGSISGGTSVNAIPESASMKVDIRSSSPAEIERVERALRNALNEAIGELGSQAADGKALITYSVKLIGDRPAAELDSEARILKVVLAVDGQLQIQTRMQRASTDANIALSLGREALTLGGGGTGGGAHTLHEWYDPSNRELGLKRILLSILMLAGVSQ